MNIQLNNLTMEFDGHLVVNEISTSINEGESVSLLDPNGFGKNIIPVLYKSTWDQNLFINEEVTKFKTKGTKNEIYS